MFELASAIFKAAVLFFANAISEMATNDMYTKAVTDEMCDMVFIGTGSGATSTQFGNLLTALIKNGTPAFKMFGVAFALMFSFIGIMELATQDRLTPEMLIKQFARFGAAFAVIIFTDDLCFLLCNFGNAMAKGAGVVVDSAVTESVAELNRGAGVGQIYGYIVWGIKGGQRKGLGEAISLFMSGVSMWIPALVMHIGNVAIFFVVISRGLELAVRSLFMPIPVAFIADDGWKGAGGRYIRKYMSIATQGMVIIAVVKIMGNFIKSVSASVLSTIISQIPAGYDASKVAKEIGFEIMDVVYDTAYWNSASTVGMIVPSGGVILDAATSVNVAVSQITMMATKGAWLTVAVIFAGVGLISKSLQVCNDIWGV